eukprot:23536-Chlamydomonas_euryale.AAC.1
MREAFWTTSQSCELCVACAAAAGGGVLEVSQSSWTTSQSCACCMWGALWSVSILFLGACEIKLRRLLTATKFGAVGLSTSLCHDGCPPLSSFELLNQVLMAFGLSLCVVPQQDAAAHARGDRAAGGAYGGGASTGACHVRSIGTACRIDVWCRRRLQIPCQEKGGSRFREATPFRGSGMPKLVAGLTVSPRATAAPAVACG